MKKTTQKHVGNLIDLRSNSIFKASIYVENGLIAKIENLGEGDSSLPYISPGFIDAHVHIESSMVTPGEFAYTALRHGTVGTVSDPHEIANVLGIPGVQFMIDNANQAPFHFWFGAPSCVPATSFETAGAKLSASDVGRLLDNPEIHYLSEMMNWPGVINRQEDVLEVLREAIQRGVPIDGHAPGLNGEQAKAYFNAGISTDHECFSLEEATEKANLGVRIIIREGSAAKNFEALHPLYNTHPKQLMLCSDDKHPDDLERGHIQDLVLRALDYGYDYFDVMRSATLNPVAHYSMNVGTLREGESADFICMTSPRPTEILATYIRGECVHEKGSVHFKPTLHDKPNQFEATPINSEDIEYTPSGQFPVIQAIDGSLITEKVVQSPSSIGTENNCLKLVVVNRYAKSKPAIAYVKGFGLTEGAIASTVAHDSHNIIAVGADDASLVQAINLVIKVRGGLSYASKNKSDVLPLPIAGLMSDKSVLQTGQAYEELNANCVKSGCKLGAPYMTLSFLALLVIPKLKLSDLGLFDAEKFEFVDYRK